MPQDDFSGISATIKGAAGVIALLPGVALLFDAVTLPPSLSTMIKALALACGVVIILLVVIAKEKLQAMSTGKFAWMTIAAVIIGCATALFYQNFAVRHRLNLPDHEMVATPISPSPQLRALLSNFAGDYNEAVMNPIVGPQVLRLVQAENDSANVIIVSTLVFAQLLITFAIVAAAWRVANRTTQR